MSLPSLAQPPPRVKCTVLIFSVMTSGSSATFAYIPTFDSFDMQLLFDPRSFIHIRIPVRQKNVTSASKNIKCSPDEASAATASVLIHHLPSPSVFDP